MIDPTSIMLAFMILIPIVNGTILGQMSILTKIWGDFFSDVTLSLIRNF